MKPIPKFTKIFDPRVFVTVTLIVINSGIFTGLYITGGLVPSTLFKFGAQYSPSIWQGEFWRLLTTIFLHYNFVHLLFNMYALYILGWFVEPVMGRRRFLSLYLFSGIFGSVISVVMNPAYISVGASGAVFGLAGAALVLRILHGSTVKKSLSEPFVFFLMLFIVFNIIIGFIHPGVDNAAHLAGVFCGGVLGYYFMARIPEQSRRLPLARTIYLLFSLIFALSVLYCIRPVFSAPWNLWYAENMHYLGHFEEAEKSYRRATDLEPEKSLYHRELGKFLILRSRSQDALNSFENARKLREDSGESDFLAGVAHLAHGDTDKARRFYESAVQRDYFNAKTLVLLGGTYFYEEEWQCALDAFVRAIRLRPREPIGYQAALLVLTRHGKKEEPELLQYLQRETQTSSPRPPLYYLFLATYFRHFRHFEKALRFYETALESMKEEYVLRYDISYCLMKMNRLQEAERELNLFLANLPDIDYAQLIAQKNIPLMLKMKILKKQGKEKKAMEIRDQIEQNYRKLLQKEKNVMYLNNLAYHFAGENYKVKEAVQLAFEASRKNSQAYVLDTVAWSLFKSGSSLKALNFLKQALEKRKTERLQDIPLILLEDIPSNLRADEEDRMYYYHLAAVLHALGQNQKALEAVNRAILHQGDFEEFEEAVSLLNRLLKLKESGEK